MNRFEEPIVSVQAKPFAIIHLGAGSCKEAGFYKSLAPKQIIFVEPEPELAKKASDKFNNSPNVLVIACAIAPMNGRQSLKVTNNHRFSSLLSPSQLLDFYPNVVVSDKIEIQAITLKQLCENENIVDQGDNLLVAELQGLEKNIFPLLAKKTLHKFKWVIIRSREHVLYKATSVKPQKNLTQTMCDMGYTTLTFAEDSPPFINILCIRHDAELEKLKTISVHKKIIQT